MSDSGTETLDESIKKTVEGKNDSNISRSTLFVSTIPYEATDDQLEQFFSQIGPVRHSFIVKKDSASNGCGFVQFAMPEDAAKALVELNKVKFMDKRILKMEMAKKKKKKVRQSETPEEEKEVVSPKRKKTVKKPVDEQKPIISNPAEAPTHSVMVTGLPAGVSQKQLYKKLRKYGEVKQLTFPWNSQSTAACAMFSSYGEAMNVCKSMDQHTFKRSVVSCTLHRRARLIVRNLAFSCTPEHLRSVFECYGTIVDCSVPMKNKDGRTKCGFGFVEFVSSSDGQKAVEAVNGQNILDRQVAVDWAIAKSVYDRISHLENSVEATAEANDPTAESLEIKVTAEEDEDTDVEYLEIPADDDSDSDQDEPESDVQVDVKKQQPLDVKDSTLFVRNLSFETQETDLLQHFAIFGKLRYARITMDNLTNMSRGSGFVCFYKKQDAEKCMNAYNEAELSASLADPANNPNAIPVGSGKTDGASKSVLKPELPQSSFANAVANSTKVDGSIGTNSVKDFSQNFTLDGRFLNLNWLISKEEANEISNSSAKQRRHTDKRNMYLLREGLIKVPLQQAPSAGNATTIASVAQKSQASYAERKKVLLKNPNLFVSKTRLSIRNMATSVDDVILRKTAKIAVSKFWKDVADGKRETLEPEVIQEEVQQGRSDPSSTPHRRIVVKQSKVMLDKTKLDVKTKKPKSKGFGFIEFESHADALACLRWLNNNPKAFAPKPTADADSKDESATSVPKQVKQVKPPLVEFAIENRLILKQREQRQQMAPKTVHPARQDRAAKKAAADEIKSPRSPITKRKSPDGEKPKTTTASFEKNRSSKKPKVAIQKETIETAPKQHKKREKPQKTQMDSGVVAKPKKVKRHVREEQDFDSMVEKYCKKIYTAEAKWLS